jgi:hypothetical protein
MEAFVRENWILTTLLILFALEQIAYLWIGSYPYRFGILVRTENLANSDILQYLSRPLVFDGLKLKVSAKHQEAYLKPKYQGYWAPIIFTAQIATSETGCVKVRMGPLAAVLVLYALINGVISDITWWSILNALLIIGVIIFFYLSFMNKYNTFAEQVKAAGNKNPT